MEQKFIKLRTKTDEYHINPFMITSIKKEIDTDRVTIYTFDGKIISPLETFKEVMDLIQDSGKFKFTF